MLSENIFKQWFNICQDHAFELTEKEVNELSIQDEEMKMIDKHLVIFAKIGKNKIKYEVPDNYWVWKN
jgi:hypothetical protein